MAIDLSEQIELENSDLKQEINFIGRLDEDNTTIFFVSKNSEETTFEFLQSLLTVILFSLIIDDI